MEDPSAQNIVINNPASAEGQKLASKFKPTLPKLIFLVLGVVIIAEIILGVRKLLSPVAPTSTTSATVAAPSAEVSLLASKSKYQVGEIVQVKVNVYTGGHQIDGADVILKYDSKLLEASSGAIKKGTIFDEYPVAVVNAEKSVVTISGISQPNKTYSGLGELATISFVAKSPGKTTVAIDYQPDQTTDSNVTETKTNKDILKSVFNLDLVIQ